MDFNGSYSLDEAALQQSVTDLYELENGGWLPGLFPELGLGPLDEDVEAPNPTGDDLDAPFKLDESDPSTICDVQPPVMSQYWTAGFENMHQNSLESSPPLRTCTAAPEPYSTISNVLGSGPGRCTWPGCDSEAFMKTQKLLETHVYNLHVNPLCCTWPGCKRQAPFGKQGDLERHVASLHQRNKSFKCPLASCTRHRNGFPRKDKLREHMKSCGHGTVRCDFSHCNISYVTKSELAQHKSQGPCHGRYECSIGSCYGSRSHFTSRGLEHHCLEQHNLNFTVAWRLGELLKLQANQHVATEATFQELGKDAFGLFRLKTACYDCDQKKIAIGLSGE